MAARYGDIVTRMTEQEFAVLRLVTETLSRLDHKVGVVYDIGAYDGTWSVAFSLYTGEGVYAFEPLPAMIQGLRERARAIPSISVQPVACGATNEESVIYENAFRPASSFLKAMPILADEWPFAAQTHPVPVRIVRLDDWVEQNQLPLPSLVKIDVQGLEDRVIVGARRTLAQAQYVWLEANMRPVYEDGSDFDSVYILLRELGFKMIDCVDLIRSPRTGKLLYFDALFCR